MPPKGTWQYSSWSWHKFGLPLAARSARSIMAPPRRPSYTFMRQNPPQNPVSSYGPRSISGNFGSKSSLLWATTLHGPTFWLFVHILNSWDWWIWMPHQDMARFSPITSTHHSCFSWRSVPLPSIYPTKNSKHLGSPVTRHQLNLKPSIFISQLMLPHFKFAE